MYNTEELELGILEFWKKNKIFEKLVSKNKGKKSWSFIDGPATANNPLGVHHAWGRTYKDTYQRFKALQGYDQRFQNGFDCHGLPVEVGVEKELGLNSKKDIENFGVENFVKKCRERVEKYAKIQTEQSIRLGQWNHWDDSYYTLSDTNIEHIWYFLKKCYDNGWLYRGTDVVPWCYRCGTALSQHELYDSYKDLTHTSVYLKFPIRDVQNEYLLVWTTTPWTLTSNVAVAVNPELVYAKVKQEDFIYYLSQGTLKSLKGDYVVLETLAGKDLVNLEYLAPYSNLEVQKNIKHRVVSWDLVSEEDGTGIVHIAPGCGKEDHDLGKKEKLPEISPLDESGNYLEGFGWLTGKNVGHVSKDIVKDLEERNFVYKTKDYFHRYPTCWRCNTELVFRLVNEWFISVKEIRPRMLEANKKIKWEPEHGGKIMEDWLNNMGDWLISRKRYWGLPLPIWECENNHLEIMGTKKDLLERATSDTKHLKELHRPWIDDVKIKCSQCHKEMTRIKDVGDAWLDAGIVSFSTLNYLEDKKYWNKWYPAELIIEMREQIRLWFYSLLFMAVTLENNTPYKTVLTHEKVHDELGRPMHKSGGNSIVLEEAAKNMGVDVMRWFYMKQDPKFNVNFGYKNSEAVKQTLSMMFNLISYLEMSTQGKKHLIPENLEVEDRWILSKLNTLIMEVTESLESLTPNIATKKIEDFFVISFSRTYIQFIRDRVQSQEGKNREAALGVLYEVNLTLIRLMSPLVPFLTESIYQKTFKVNEEIESIHLMDWPVANKKIIDEGLEKEFYYADKIMQAILFGRDKAKIGVRWPLRKVSILSDKKEVISCLKILDELIKKQTNVKNIEIVKKEQKGIEVEFDTEKLYLDNEMDEDLEREGYSRELVRRIQNLRKNAGLKKENKIELVINTDYDLKEYLTEMKSIVGASTLKFEKDKKEYTHKSLEKIKDKEFDILFNIL